MDATDARIDCSAALFTFVKLACGAVINLYVSYWKAGCFCLFAINNADFWLISHILKKSMFNIIVMRIYS